MDMFGLGVGYGIMVRLIFEDDIVTSTGMMRWTWKETTMHWRQGRSSPEDHWQSVPSAVSYKF